MPRAGMLVSVGWFAPVRIGMRKWRNRQTRTVQVRVPVRAWGFNSPLAHHLETARVIDPGRFASGPIRAARLPGMRPFLRSFVVPALGAIGVLAVAGRAARLVGGDDPREDRVVRAFQAARGHGPDDVAAVDPSEAREPLDRVTRPLSWYSGVPQTIANGALWCGVTWLLTRDRRAALAPGAALALETACFVGSAALVGRPRPQGVWRPEKPHATSSFPSGHTAAAVALHTTLADLLDRHGVRGARVLGLLLRYAIPGGIAFSRIYRGQHHISDTVAGVALGRWSAATIKRELLSS